MADKDPRFYLVRYTDFTLDVVMLYPEDIQTVKNMKEIRDMTLMGDTFDLILDRDYLIGAKKLKETEDDD